MSKQNSENENQKDSKKSTSAFEEVNRSAGANESSASRGGTTDLNNQTSGGRSASSGGSNISTKENVTGSDYDGQVSTQ
jgi:hypothetical protein